MMKMKVDVRRLSIIKLPLNQSVAKQSKEPKSLKKNLTHSASNSVILWGELERLCKSQVSINPLNGVLKAIEKSMASNKTNKLL